MSFKVQELVEASDCCSEESCKKLTLDLRYERIWYWYNFGYPPDEDMVVVAQ